MGELSAAGSCSEEVAAAVAPLVNSRPEEIIEGHDRGNSKYFLKKVIVPWGS